MYMRGCVWVSCKHCTIFYKGLEHPWILLSVWGPGTNSFVNNDSTIISTQEVRKRIHLKSIRTKL